MRTSWPQRAGCSRADNPAVRPGRPMNTFQLNCCQLWEKYFSRLIAYKRRHGDCNVPRRYLEDPQLAGWVHQQRNNRRSSNYHPDREAKLNRRGFIWNTREFTWQKNVQVLTRYKRRHGDCNVPKSHRNKPLVQWVYAVRRRYHRKELPPARVKQLTDLGFTWNWGEAHWQEKYQLLIAYKRRHGDCNVPQDWKKDGLGKWVNTQRTFRRGGRLSKSRLRLLNKLGFVWNSIEARWRSRYAALIEYKKHHGNCNVPAGWPGNRQLANWVGVQRYFYRSGQLQPARISLLNKIGFTWG